MPQADSQPERAHPARRRTVRIKKGRTPPRAATVSLVVAGVAAVLLLAMWRFWQTEEPQPYRRKLTDVELEWKCEADHSFHAAGQVDPRECWTCGEPAYPVAHYACPLHGSYEVAVRFARGDDGVPKVSQLRLAGHRWVAVEEGLLCPRCNRPLVRKRKDPLEGIGRGRTK